VVVDAEVNKEQGRPLYGVNGEVRSKKDLTGPTLLEMSGMLRRNLCYIITLASGSPVPVLGQNPAFAIKCHSQRRSLRHGDYRQH
jgi:hypothetical protein